MTLYRFLILLVLLAPVLPSDAAAGTLAWPIGCIPGVNCLRDGTFHISYPDVTGSGRAFNCGPPGYVGHTGTDVTVSSVEDGVAVLAADDGEVLWVSGGKYDRCPNDAEPECKPELRPVISGLNSSANCTDFGPSCGADDCCIAWGFNAGNFILIKHNHGPDAALTFYAHLRVGSILVANGQQVKKGEKIAEVGSSGASLTPHLHFSVWNRRNGRYILADPWAGKCGPNFDDPLWQFNPPYGSTIQVAKTGTGAGVVTSGNGELNCGRSCSTTVVPGTIVSLKATPYSGSTFKGWQGACKGQGAACTVVADGDLPLTAEFNDSAPPTVSVLAVPSFSTGLTVPITSFQATDNVKVTGYLITETPTPPSPDNPSWTPRRPATYACSSPGSKALYAWVKDDAGNISTSARTSVTCGAVNSALSAPALPLPATPSSNTLHGSPLGGS